MDYDERLQNFIEQLNESVSTYDFRVREGRKYDYVQKDVPNYGWQDVFAVVKTTDCEVAWGHTKVKPGDYVDVNGSPKRGTATGTIMTSDNRQLDGLDYKGSIRSRKADSYKELLEDRDYNGMP